MGVFSSSSVYGSGLICFAPGRFTETGSRYSRSKAELMLTTDLGDGPARDLAVVAKRPRASEQAHGRPRYSHPREPTLQRHRGILRSHHTSKVLHSHEKTLLQSQRTTDNAETDLHSQQQERLASEAGLPLFLTFLPCTTAAATRSLTSARPREGAHMEDRRGLAPGCQPRLNVPIKKSTEFITRWQLGDVLISTPSSTVPARPALYRVRR